MSSKPMAGCKVLVVEDDYLIGIDLAEMLERAGAEVSGPVASVREAFAALVSPPDIATLDIQLGDETSFPIADELASRGVPFLFATAAADMVPAAHRCRPVCPKPLLRSAVLKAIAAALAK